MALACAVLLLLVSLQSVEAKKANNKNNNKATAQPTGAAAAAAGGYSAAAAAAAAGSATPTPAAAAAAAAPSAETAAARELAAKQLKRKEELARKREEKRAAAQAVSLRAARLRNNQLRQRRLQKAARDAKAAAAAKARADDLVAKKRAADTPDIRRRGHEKLRWLLAQSAASRSRLINIDTPNYNAMVNEGPRPYHLMLVYTALSSAHSCHYCHMANDALVPVAQAHFERSRGQVAHVLAANSTADIDHADLPVFFVNVDMARNGELFKELRFTSAPYMLLAPPRLGTATLKPNDFLKSLAPRYRFNLQASMAPADFNSFVNKLVGCHVQLDDVKPGLTDLIGALVVLGALGFVGVRFGADIIATLRSFRGVKAFAMVAGLALYCWSISGGFYNILVQTQTTRAPRAPQAPPAPGPLVHSSGDHQCASKSHLSISCAIV